MDNQVHYFRICIGFGHQKVSQLRLILSSFVIISPICRWLMCTLIWLNKSKWVYFFLWVRIYYILIDYSYIVLRKRYKLLFSKWRYKLCQKRMVMQSTFSNATFKHQEITLYSTRWLSSTFNFLKCNNHYSVWCFDLFSEQTMRTCKDIWTLWSRVVSVYTTRWNTKNWIVPTVYLCVPCDSWE